MVTVLVLAVLALKIVPVQLLICHPAVGTAPVRLMLSPAKNLPVVQPTELAGLATGLLPWPVWLRVNA
jgi:hypothetical protein